MIGAIARLSADLGTEIRGLSLSGPRAAAGSRTALASLLSILAALALDLDDPWWAGITALVLIQKNAKATFSRSVDRVVGTIAGAAIGYLLASTIQDHFAFQAIVLGVSAFTF